MNSKHPSSCNGVIASKTEKGKMSFQQVSIFKPKKKEMLVQVYAAGVNRADVEQAKGSYPPPAGAPETIGLELSGIVVDTGEEVTKFKNNDRVMSLVPGGAYAEYAIVQEETSMQIPKGMSFEQAAAIPEAYYTIWYNVFSKGNLKTGEVFVVHGGASGVGSAAIQIAKVMGAKVIATVGSDEKIEACKKLGADYVINYKTQSFEKSILEYTNNEGVDVILDWVGAEYLDAHLKLLRRNGRLICIDTRELKAALDFDLLLGNCLTITGSLLRPVPLSDKEKFTQAIEKYLLPKLASGEIQPLVYRVLPIEEAQQAHQILEESKHIGKVVLSMNRP
jgi:putative PIG3 family NAD(P)H quinone oxidoreductase